MKTAIELIADERQEQIEKHGYTVEKDVSINEHRQLAEVASTLIHPSISTPRKRLSVMPANWNDEVLLKMCKKDYMDRLIIAGALIVAEIERLKWVNEMEEGKL